MKLTVLIGLLLLSHFSCCQGDEGGSFEKVSSQGTDIYYRVFGEGKPLLIVGGGPGDHSDRYLDLTHDLSNHFTCILVEQRGIGKSRPAVFDSTTINIALSLADFEEIRIDLGYDQWGVLGFSFGGYISSLYASSYPESISSLILMESIGLNINTFNYFMDNVMSRLTPSDKQLVGYWTDSTRWAEDPSLALAEWVRAIMPGYFYDREKSFIVSENIREYHFTYGIGQWIWKDIFKRNLDLTQKESTFSNPVLILHGRQDPVGESVPLALSDYYKNSTLVFIEKCGHYPWVEQPEKVYDAITEFINH